MSRLWKSLPSRLFGCSSEKHRFVVVHCLLRMLVLSSAIKRGNEAVSAVASELPSYSSLTLFMAYFTALFPFLITEPMTRTNS